MRDYSPQAVADRLYATPSLMQMLRASAAHRPNHSAIDFYRQARDAAPETLTYAELLAQTESLARMLEDAGIGPEDGIAILLPTIPECVVAFIAASFVGVVFPINLLLSSTAMAHQMGLAKVKAAIVLGASSNADLYTRFSEAAKELPHLQTVLEVDLAKPGIPFEGASPATFNPVAGHGHPTRRACRERIPDRARAGAIGERRDQTA